MHWLRLLICVSILWPTFVRADPTCTGVSFPFDAPTDPQSQNYTVPTVSHGITLVFPSVRNASRTVSSATLGGNALTEIGTRITSTNTAHQVFYMVNAPSGVQSVNINWDNTPLSYVLTVVTCDEVDQTNPISNTTTATGSGTTVTVNCSSATGQTVVDFPGASNSASGFTPGAGQTILDQDVADSLLSAGASFEAGAGTVTMSHTQTSGDWATRCVALAAFVATRRAASPMVFQ